MLHYIRREKFASYKHSSFLGPFQSSKENEVVWMQPLNLTFEFHNECYSVFSAVSLPLPSGNEQAVPDDHPEDAGTSNAPPLRPHHWHELEVPSDHAEARLYCTESRKHSSKGTLKGEVPLYCWPPFWLAWNQLYDNWQFSFIFAKQTNPNRPNRRVTVQRYFHLKCSLL